ncbi:MAG: hypothetical protein KDA41_09295 [Planctomycetales bacterium]|nr:hypothetical protein [Planctomycetales bacterium]
MNAPRNSNTVAAALTSGAGALLVTLIVGWLTVGRDAVGREDVIELIETHGPYVAERQALHNAVELNATRTDDLQRLTHELERQGHRVEAKLDLLLQRLADNAPRPTSQP